ncbi:hypothetical protein KAS14_05255 [Candidatus Bathyarchaeota archaeon]|nr:hypothetical protein [Candidatus Bathyarchaeota archaeon]
MVPKWLVIAKNEYNLRLSGIRSIRPYFPYIVIGLLAVYVAFIAPAIVSAFIDELLAFFLSQVAVAMIQILMFLLFIYILILPITYTLRDVQTGQLEIFLAAPIKPSDVLLGEFLGVVPFYAIAVAVVAGFFTAVLNPLGLGLVQIAIIIMVFVLIFFSALWIGSLIAALLRTKFGKASRGKDIGRALSVILVLPLIALMYAIMSGGVLEALANPGTSGIVKTLLSLVPSSWGAEVIISFASNPGDIAAVGVETLIRFGGQITFLVVVLWLGTKVANRAYSLEPITFTASRAKPDGVFYKSIKYLLGGKSSSSLLVSVCKDYGRRLENLSWLVYVVGLVVMLNIFFGDPSSDLEDTLFSLSLMMSPFLATFVVGTGTTREKANLFIFKKAPSGMGKFVKARLLQGLIVVVPIAAAVTVIFTIVLPQITLISLLTNTILVSLRATAFVIFVLGFVLLIPSFSEKSRDRTLHAVINLQITIFTSIGLTIILPILGLDFRKILPNLDLFMGFLYNHLLQTAIISLVGIMLISLGKRKLRRIE